MAATTNQRDRAAQDESAIPDQRGMEAMRKTAIAMGLLVLSASTSVGCKSTSKLAWWKSNKADETALAHAAPELPSDAAKKAEGAQVAGGAAPFKPANTTGSTAVAAKSGSGYPSTDAPAFTPSAVTQVAANTTPTAGAAGPYDPAATPAPKSPTTSVATTGTDRYGLGSTAATGASPAGATTAPAYGQAPSGVASSAPSYSPTTDLAGVASRYGTPATSTTAPAVAATTPVAPAYSPAAVTPVSMAATQPYRPGGTSSYNVSVASLPTSTASPTPATTSSASGAATTPTSTAPTAPATTPTTGTNRYW
jgi:hypothetical protein